MSEKPLSHTPAHAETEAFPLKFEEAEIYLHEASSHVTSVEQGRATAQAAALAESRRPEKAPTLFVELKRVGGRVSAERRDKASRGV